MQRIFENLAKAGYLRAHAQGHLYSAMGELHRSSPDVRKLRSSVASAIAALETLRRVQTTIDRKTFVLLSDLSKHQSCKPGN